ncbi:dimethyl sulfoxide reductase subunit A [Dehalobacter sp. MCB1]|uniref:molybdopterin-dependent oxidoreductase n=1 Tax=unclassified Dehalobacter TaxID=2635733 RepID=UPI000E6CA962|nr:MULTISPECIES: molybdopterin-dependent oxidoreductase [unclassified Dehalobacter]RJE47275.1 dimethyl sulfoxide reductase subunit A [Dehalobacter sp. MCB1]TCX54871.1 dimethyl sulfoxide reductase subunit A [Dehalobacter sp. 12DCB1]
MADVIDRICDLSLSRRAFIKASTAAVAGLSLAGCGNTLKTVSTPVKLEERWVTGSCIYDCGGRCLNKALIRDGIVIRQKTDDTHPDSPDFFQQRACNRGRSLREHVFAADRLKYPMKRKHWEPGGGNKSLRGIDEWERISWDEALDILASELKKAKENYGNRSILIPHTSTRDRDINKVISLYGGYVSTWGTTSFGSWGTTATKVGYLFFSPDPVNDRIDMRKCDTVIMLGLNPAWSSPGSAFYHYLQVKEAGAKFIAIDPFYTDSAAALGAEWLPVRPGTDTALLLGIAHTLIVEDDPVTNPLIDWDFLKRCTIGFDAESMPKDEDPKENFKDYVLGTYDGHPKSADWASKICGLEPRQIRYIAHELRKDKKVAFLSSWAPARTSNSDGLPQLMMTLGAMTGHIGKSGHMTGCSVHRGGGNGGPYFLYKVGADKLPAIPRKVNDYINFSDLWQALLDGHYKSTGNKALLKAEEKELDIHVILQSSSNILGTTPNVLKGIEATRKVDFVAGLGQFLTASVKYSDLVLPVTTGWENVGEINRLGTKEALIISTQVIEPLYEAKTDRWIAIELMKRLSLKESDLFPFSEKQAFFNTIANTTVIDQSGKVTVPAVKTESSANLIMNTTVIQDAATFVPLARITAEDITEWGVQGAPQDGIVPFKELLEKGVYQIERKPGDNLEYIAFKKFVDDPEANPLKTSSGKFEIFSRDLANTINNMGYSSIKPIPTYIPPIEGYEDTFTDWNTQTKGEYPYQIVSLHHLSKAHTNFSNNPWLMEAWNNPIYMSSKDAESHKLKENDTVLVSSKYGKVLRTAHITERMMPGTMAIHHGCWPDIDNATGIDKGGSDNVLLGTPATGAGLNAYNSCLVKIEKWTDTPLIPDVEKSLDIIF